MKIGTALEPLQAKAAMVRVTRIGRIRMRFLSLWLIVLMFTAGCVPIRQLPDQPARLSLQTSVCLMVRKSSPQPTWWCRMD
jgi:hypothetical protein